MHLPMLQLMFALPAVAGPPAGRDVDIIARHRTEGDRLRCRTTRSAGRGQTFLLGGKGEVILPIAKLIAKLF
jgi:hypothetical protein